LSGLVLQKQSLCRRRVTILKKEEIRAEKGAEKGRSDANADRPAATARSSRAARATGAHEAVVPVETASWAPIALTVLGDQAVVTRRGEEAPLNGYFLTSAPYLCPFRMHAREK
jgi:hypothetical protein